MATFKYCVMDEIHTISERDQGAVWERVLVLMPCPVIALSATIGNYDQFSTWIARVMKEKGHDITLIQHGMRWNDIEMFLYQGQEIARSPESIQWQLG
jgi:superfamily II RNA helicase